MERHQVGRDASGGVASEDEHEAALEPARGVQLLGVPTKKVPVLIPTHTLMFRAEEEVHIEAMIKHTI